MCIRDRAITGDEAYQSYQNLYRDVKELSVNLNTNPNELKSKINSIKITDEANNNLINDLNKKVSTLYYYKLVPIESDKTKTSFFIEDCSDLSPDQIKLLSDNIKSKNKNSIAVLISGDSDKINCYVGVSKDCKHRYNAKQIISELNLKFSAKGGGSPTFGTSVITGQKPSVVIKYIKELVKA